VPLDEIGYEERVRDNREASRTQVVERTLHEAATEPMSFESRLDIDVDENARARLEPVSELGDEHAVEVEFVPQHLGVVDNAHISEPRHLDRVAGRVAVPRRRSTSSRQVSQMPCLNCGGPFHS
jgi:hypothetical protein